MDITSTSFEKRCNCPLCGQGFTPADGLTSLEHLARGVIQVFSELQAKHDVLPIPEASLPCPRCGEYRMLEKAPRNALSRQAKIYVCPICGTDEAYRAYIGEALPIAEWWAVRELLNRNEQSL